MSYLLVPFVALLASALTLFSGFGLGTLLLPAFAVWFPVDAAAGGVQTPFWPAPFPWSSLRRLDP